MSSARLAKVAIALLIACAAAMVLAGCGPRREPREVPEWKAGPFHDSVDQGFRIFPLRSFMIENYGTRDTSDDLGGTLIYAILNQDGVGDLDIDLDSVTLLAGRGGKLAPESHATLYRSEHVVIGGLAFPTLPAAAERLDVEITRLRGDDGSTVEGRWLVEEVLMEWGNARMMEDATLPARMEFAHLRGSFYREGDVVVGIDVHEYVTDWHSSLRRPLVWVADPDIHFVPFHLELRTPLPGWDKSLNQMPE